MVAETKNFKRRKTATMKGLPYVNMKQNVNQKHFKLKLPLLPEMTYEFFLWFVMVAISALLAPILYPFTKAETFGNNFYYIISIYLTCYSLDLITVTFQYATGTAKPRQLRMFGLFDDILAILYTMMLPLTAPTMVGHVALSTFRDTNYAVFADIIRINFWPDNEHNRKRVANLQSVVEKYGITIWIQMFKTPILRGFIGYWSLEWFSQPDKELTLMRLLLFPLKVIVYELVNDFIYYWFHRYLHENKFLYKHIHKLHHESKCPTGLGASTMTVGETSLTFALTEWVTPFILSPFIPFTITEYGIFTCWIASIEVFGHSGQILEMGEPSNWRMGLSGLLTTLGVQLEVKDHELHHWNNDFNYCKRTQMWDKVFGTFDYDNQSKAANASLEEKAPQRAPRKGSQ